MMNFYEQTIGNAQKYNETAAKLALNVSRRVVQVLDEKDQGEASDSLRIVVAKLVEDDQKMNNNRVTFRALKTQLSKLDSKDWPDVEQEFKRLQEENNNNNNFDAADHKWTKEFVKIFEDADEDSEDLGGDDELSMTQVEVNTVCPITRTEMRRPVKNLNCGHVYDKGSIDELLKQGSRARTITRCPVVGCPNKNAIQPDRLVVDNATKRALIKKKKN